MLLFSDKHPYFPESCAKCTFYKPGFRARLHDVFLNRRKDCYNCPYIDGCIDRDEEIKHVNRERVKELRRECQPLSQAVFTNPGFPHSAVMSNADIKEWLNQPHKYYREKNEILLSLESVFRKAKYMGTTIDPKRRPGVKQSHLFEIDICGEKNCLIVHEMTWHEYKIHGVSDSRRLWEMAKKKAL